MIGRDEPARAAHQTAATTPTDHLSPVVADLVTEHHHAVTHRNTAYERIQRAQRDQALDRHLGLHRTTSLGRSAGRSQGQERDQGYDLGL